jgi:hypothetical protein
VHFMPLSCERTGNIAFAGSIHRAPPFASVFWSAVFWRFNPLAAQPLSGNMPARPHLATVQADLPSQRAPTAPPALIFSLNSIFVLMNGA